MYIDVPVLLLAVAAGSLSVIALLMLVCVFHIIPLLLELAAAARSLRALSDRASDELVPGALSACDAVASLFAGARGKSGGGLLSILLDLASGPLAGILAGLFSRRR